MVREVTKQRTFKGSNTTLWLLICCTGVIPGLIYYWIKCEEKTITKHSKESNKSKK